uniref:CLOCK-interacting pacemaker isoform X1 n=2 Tax=Pogona vitticeps TaxID=103695 RepID=A0A6J0T761_9SAUR
MEEPFWLGQSFGKALGCPTEQQVPRKGGAMPAEGTPMPAKEEEKAGGAAAAGPGTAIGLSAKGSSRMGESRKMARGHSEISRTSDRPASEGEKDSGFSDVSSEYLSTVEQTDSEDQPADSRHQAPKGQKRAPPPKAPGGLAAGGTFPGLTPVYIVKNVILKQPLGTSPAPQFLAWGGQHPLNGAQGSPARVLFIQSPVASLKPLLPSQKPSAKETYFPALSTYPKIAPHPGPDPQAKGATEGGPAPAGRAIKGKQFCLEEARASSSEAATPKDREGGERPPGGERPLPPPLPSGRTPSLRLGAAETPSQTSLLSSGRRLEQAEGRMLARASKKLSGSGLGKQRRFHNTVEILRRSGLLGITLRTKELLRQNGRTQRELSELRAQAQLFCQAVQNQDAQAWARLQQAMDHPSADGATEGGGGGGSSRAPPGGGPNWGAEPAVPILEDAAGEPPPCSPMNLSLTPGPSVPVAMP